MVGKDDKNHLHCHTIHDLLTPCELPILWFRIAKEINFKITDLKCLFKILDFPQISWLHMNLVIRLMIKKAINIRNRILKTTLYITLNWQGNLVPVERVYDITCSNYKYINYTGSWLVIVY